jgi:autotransporter-associated beta strand protein
MKTLIRLTIGSSRLAIGVALLSGLMPVARATDHYYTNNATATYNVATYWNPNTVPGSADNAMDDNGANLCLILATDPTWSTFDLRAGNAAGATGGFWQQGSTVNCTSWFRMGVGSSTSVGTYSISGGTLNINGTSTYMRIGELGFGTLNITNGAVNHTGTTPNPCIIGSRDTGNYGNSSSPGGVINQSGGTFTDNGELWVGEGITAVTAGVVGTYNLSGTGILYANNYLAVGRSWANGTFNMTGGSVTKNATGTITLAGIGTTQTGTFNLSGGNLTNTASQTWVGETGNGVFNLSGTGVAILGTTDIGYNTGNGIFNESAGTATLGTTYFGFGLGTGAKGALNLSGSGVFNPSILILGNTNAAQGYVIQTGGSVSVSSGDDRIGGNAATTGANAIGFYNLSAGSLTVANNFQIGAYGTGELNLSGSGTWTQTGGYPDVGRFVGGFGVVDISGGTMNQNSAGTLFIVGEQGTGTLNIRGGILNNTANNTTTAVSLGHTSTGVGILNLLGGTLNTLSVGSPAAAGSSSTLNFNGGKLQARNANATFLQGLTGAYVYPGGGTIDSQGNNITIAQNLVVPTGNGVTSIPVNAVGAGYVTPPIVKISGGGGTNATAIALTNGVGQVASILITSPGVNYTTAPTVTLVGGGFTSTASIGTVTIGANSTGGLTKLGSGALTMTGNSTYGVTTISNGTVIVNGSISGGAMVVNGTLGGGGTIGGTTTMGTNTTLSPGITTPATTLTVTNLTLNNANLAMNLNPSTTTPGTGNNDLIAANGALVFTGTNTVIPTIISGGSGSLSGIYTLISGGTTVSGGATNFAFFGGTRSSATFDTTSTPGSVLMTVIGNAANLVWVGTNGNNWDTATINWNKGGTADKFYALDYVTFDDTSSNGNVSLVGPLQPTSVVFNNNATNYVLSGTGFIKGAATLTMSGGGSLVLVNSNSYTGGTTISSGTVQVGTGGSVGSLGSGPIVDNGLLIYDLNSALTNTVGISGSGSLVQAGTGTLYLTVSNIYTGFTLISSGTIKNGRANALPSSSGFNDVTNNGKLDLNTFSQSLDSLSGSGIVDTVAGGAPVLTVGGDNASTTFNGVLANTTGTLGLTKVGNGTLTLTGTNTFLNNTFVRAGTLMLDGGVISNTAFGDVGQTTGDNALMILQGTGSFTTINDFNVGDINNSIGVVNIIGSASLTAQNLYVSSANNATSSAQGTINQTNGTVTTRTSGDNALVIGGRIAASTYGIGIYNLYGGTVNVLNGGNLWCGGYGTGTMNVSNGFAYLSGYFSVGRQTNSTGYLNISGGVVLQTNTGRYTLIGESGTGTLNLSGGMLGVTKLRLGNSGSASGTVNLTGGTLAAQQILQVAGSGAFNFNGGILQASASSATFMQGLNSAVVQSGGAMIDPQTNSITILQGLTDGGGGGGLTKNGNGLLVLAGTNTYTGTTTVNAGELDGVPGLPWPARSPWPSARPTACRY